MIILLILIVALITYFITKNYTEKKSLALQQQLRDEFQEHIYTKEREHVQYIDNLNFQFNKKIEDQIDRFSIKYGQLKDEYGKLVQEGRKDAVKRSRQVVSGQVYEQISPLVPGFPFELKDVRHVGNPLDFLIFRGLSDSDAELEIVFLEIKSGTSDLNGNERRVRKAVAAGRVRYEVFRPDANQDVGEKLEASVTQLRPGILTPGEMVLPAPTNSISIADDGTETLKCGHCKREFDRPISPGRKPLFCPPCRGAG